LCIGYISGEIAQNKGILIKPEQSEVSIFCTKLTTIDQALLDNEGITFLEACEILRDEYHAGKYTWASYGEYDLKMMKRQCKRLNVFYPMSEKHINVKDLFAGKLNRKKRTGMIGALDLLHIPLEGIHHRGIDDAKNIAKILNRCLSN
jgi:inhibitor of KinA sporulation pathway (predicted exonuclease)